jgi:hypothetical protein
MWTNFEAERQRQRTATESHLRQAWEKWLFPAFTPEEKRYTFELILELLRFRAMIENTKAFFQFLYRPFPEPVCVSPYHGGLWNWSPYR